MTKDRLRMWMMHGFFVTLSLVSIRHFLIEGDHLWTGEGARFSWSMRLRGKVCGHWVRREGEGWKRPNFKPLSLWQRANLDDPYLFYLFVRETYCRSGRPVYGKINCRSISHLPSPLIRSEVNLCQADYHFLSHNDWIYPRPGPWDPQYRNWFESPKREIPE